MKARLAKKICKADDKYWDLVTDLLDGKKLSRKDDKFELRYSLEQRKKAKRR